MHVGDFQGGLFLEGVAGLPGASAKLLCPRELVQVPGRAETGSCNHSRANHSRAHNADDAEAEAADAEAEAADAEADDAEADAEADDDADDADDAEADSINNNSRSKIFSLSLFGSFFLSRNLIGVQFDIRPGELNF